MKRKRNKVHRNFKISPALNEALVREASRMRRTQTMVLEMALATFFAIKH